MIACLQANGQRGNQSRIGQVVHLLSISIRAEQHLGQRVTHLKLADDRSPTFNSLSRGSGYSSPSLSGYQTPRELKEEQWRQEAHIAKPNKLEMRTMYKQLGGRKSRGKAKLGSSGIRDKGGWAEGDGDL
jgi:hypothetical protein